jgi:hypothetical protein
VKNEQRSQIVELGEFLRNSKTVVYMKAAGAGLVSYAAFIPFVGLELLPWWFGAIISFAWSGFVMWDSADYMKDQIDKWTKDLTVFMVSTESKAENVSESQNPVKGLSINMNGLTSSGTASLEVDITQSQLLELVEASAYGEKLVRSSLTVDVWPSLSREWREDKIQTKARLLGLIDHNNKFRFNGRGVVFDGPPEVEEAGDIGNGVGGSEQNEHGEL